MYCKIVNAHVIGFEDMGHFMHRIDYTRNHPKLTDFEIQILERTVKDFVRNEEKNVIKQSKGPPYHFSYLRKYSEHVIKHNDATINVSIQWSAEK